MTPKVVLQDIKKMVTDAVIVGIYEDERPLRGLAGELDWLLCGSLSRIVSTGRLRGALGEAALVASRGKIPADKIFMIGLGSKQDIDLERIESAVKAAALTAARAGAKSAAMAWPGGENITIQKIVYAVARGLEAAQCGGGVEFSVVAPNAELYKELLVLSAADTPSSGAIHDTTLQQA